MTRILGTIYTRLRELLKTFLSRNGFRVSTAKDSAEARQLVAVVAHSGRVNRCHQSSSPPRASARAVEHQPTFDQRRVAAQLRAIDPVGMQLLYISRLNVSIGPFGAWCWARAG